MSNVEAPVAALASSAVQLATASSSSISLILKPVTAAYRNGHHGRIPYMMYLLVGFEDYVTLMQHVNLYSTVYTLQCAAKSIP